MNPYKRVIIYSDYAHCFNLLENLFVKYRYQCLQLDGVCLSSSDRRIVSTVERFGKQP